MIVMGIDASLRNFGVAVATLDPETLQFDTLRLNLISTETDKSQRKVVRRNSEDLERCQTLQTELTALLEVYKPTLVFVEMPVGSQSARAMASYGMSIGVLSSIRQPLIQVTPYEVKLAACGTKTATKQEMIDWAVGRYPEAPWIRHHGKVVAKNEHLADAVAAIEAGIRSNDGKAVLSMYRASLAA